MRICRELAGIRALWRCDGWIRDWRQISRESIRKLLQLVALCGVLGAHAEAHGFGEDVIARERSGEAVRRQGFSAPAVFRPRMPLYRDQRRRQIGRFDLVHLPFSEHLADLGEESAS